MQEQETSRQPAPGPHRLLAVLYTFEVYRDGEHRLVPQEQLPASRLERIQPQLESVPKRSLVDYGPGILVYNNYQDARQAAQSVSKVADHVALREVVAGAEAGAEAVWTAANGARYSSVDEGISGTVKG